MGIDKYSLRLQARHPSKGAGKRGLECDAVSACTLRTDSVSMSYLEAAYIKPLIQMMELTLMNTVVASS